MCVHDILKSVVSYVLPLNGMNPHRLIRAALMLISAMNAGHCFKKKEKEKKSALVNRDL